MSLLKKSTLLIMLVLLVVLVGCKKDDEKSETTTEANQTTTTVGSTTTTLDQPDEPVDIRIAVWWQAGDDPTFIDPATGEYNDAMSPALRQARLDALDTVKEELNINLQWVEYPATPIQDILQSVLAGDPIAEIVGMWGGSQGIVLGQNVLQDISDYKDAAGDEASWMFGSMDLFGRTMGFAQDPNFGFPTWPLVYNITYLENCNDLVTGGYADDQGNVKLPAQLWEEGNWTWATFKDYLTKVKACTFDTGMIGGTRGRVVHAYEEDYRQAWTSLVAANGDYVVRPDGTLGTDSASAVKATEFLQDLLQEGIMWSETYDDGYTPGWTWNGSNFSSGETVFTSIHNWGLDGAVSAFTDRGEEMGIVPYPVGPDTEADPVNNPYHAPLLGGNSYAIPKGIDAETARLAIAAYAMYQGETFKNLGYEDTDAYVEATNNTTAAKYFPITDEVYGDSLKNAYNDWIGSFNIFDAAQMLQILDVHATVAQVVADPNKDALTELTAVKPTLEAKLAELRDTLDGSEIVDNQAPVVNRLEGTYTVFPIGTDLTTIDMSQYFEAYDPGKDTDFTLDDITFNFDDIDVNTPNNNAKLKVTATDSSGNELDQNWTVHLYDPAETVLPEIALKNEDAIEFDIDFDLSTVSWGDYVTVKDQLALADGTILKNDKDEDLTFDLIDDLDVDISQVDVSTPDTYTVELTVTDYAGNTDTFSLDITIVEPAE